MPILHGQEADINKTLPMKYLWARDYYKAAIANHWIPEMISLREDSEQWHCANGISGHERDLIKKILGVVSRAASSGVICMAYCPIAVLYVSPSLQGSLSTFSFHAGVGTKPTASCGSSIPVREVNPKALYQYANRSIPRPFMSPYPPPTA